VLFELEGLSSPKPTAESLSEAIPLSTKKSKKEFALFSERVWLKAFGPEVSVWP